MMMMMMMRMRRMRIVMMMMMIVMIMTHGVMISDDVCMIYASMMNAVCQ